MARPSYWKAVLAILDPDRCRVGSPGSTALTVVAAAVLVLTLVLAFDARGLEQAGEKQPVGTPKSDADATMTVTGRVLDLTASRSGTRPSTWSAGPRRPGSMRPSTGTSSILGRETDGEGRSPRRPRTSSARFTR
ncbi:MAG: hypothetical protein WKF75_20070 [Singulisphaera sp.]